MQTGCQDSNFEKYLDTSRIILNLFDFFLTSRRSEFLKADIFAQRPCRKFIFLNFKSQEVLEFPEFKGFRRNSEKFNILNLRLLFMKSTDSFTFSIHRSKMGSF